MKYRRAGEPMAPTPLRARRAVEPSPRATAAPERLATIRGIAEVAEARRQTPEGWLEVWAEELRDG